MAVAHARNVSLPENTIKKSLALIDGLDPAATTSLQRDLATGKPSELEGWTGAVVRLGREANVATPLNELIYQSLLPGELRARASQQSN
jgi:2-dehydropantoate 2-reductase